MSNPGLHQGLAGQVVKRLQRRGGPAMGLRMTAMIDVIFLLLTFFVLTAKFPSPEKKLPVTMPKPTAQTRLLNSGPMKIELKAAASGCHLIVGAAGPIVLSEKDLDAGLAAASAAMVEVARSYDIAGQGVAIYCDDTVQWDYIVKVYDMLYRMGATQITFVSQEKSS